MKAIKLTEESKESLKKELGMPEDQCEELDDWYRMLNMPCHDLYFIDEYYDDDFFGTGEWRVIHETSLLEHFSFDHAPDQPEWFPVERERHLERL